MESKEQRPAELAAAPGSAIAITDASLLNYLEWKERVEMARNHNVSDYLVLAADGTTCWGITLRMAIKAAMAHDFPSPNEPS